MISIVHVSVANVLSPVNRIINVPGKNILWLQKLLSFVCVSQFFSLNKIK